MKNGILITFEGIDGSGKTTQIHLIRHWLENDLRIRVLVTRQPGGTDLFWHLRKFLFDAVPQFSKDTIATNPCCTMNSTAELLLYAADRAQHVAQVLKPELEEGAIILCDRYTDSTVAYQGYGRGLDLDTIKSLNQLATGGLEPDLTLWLDVDIEISSERLRKRQGLSYWEQSLQLQQAVRRGYQNLANEYPERIKRVNGNLELCDVRNQIEQIISKKII